ncbi:hypothetical protein CUMW_008160 [Citrus unshiu]|nr:hypothetical protein CUMW_008160 [Citrus unshiu]
MAPENNAKTEPGPKMVPVTKPKGWVVLVLRLLALAATASATIVMGLNKETKTFVVATVGTTPIKATFSAKFQHTPAFVFFVIANGLVSFHNLVMISVNLFGKKLDYKGLHLAMIAIFDLLNTVLASAGVNGAVYMAELGKHGNSHARWNKICDRFKTFCDHGGGAIIASFIGLALMIVISIISIVKLAKSKSNTPLLGEP